MHENVSFESDSDIAAIGGGLLAATLPKSEWTHAGHFAATLRLLSQRPDLHIARTLPGVIRAHNVAMEGANTDMTGYHETITQVSIRAAQAFLTDRPGRAALRECERVTRESARRPGMGIVLRYDRTSFFGLGTTALVRARHEAAAVLIPKSTALRDGAVTRWFDGNAERDERHAWTAHGTRE